MPNQVPTDSILPIFLAARLGHPILGSVIIDGEQVNWFTSYNCYLRVRFENFLVACTSILGRQYHNQTKIVSHLDMSVYVADEHFNKWKLDTNLFNAEYEIMMDKLTRFFNSVNEFNYEAQEIIDDRRTEFDTIAYVADYTYFRDQVRAIDIQTGIVQPYSKDVSDNRTLL